MSKRHKPYDFSFEYENDVQHIYAHFRDSRHLSQEAEVSEELHLELTLLNRSVRNIESSEERHKEYLELSDEELAQRGVATVPSAEDVVLNGFQSDELRSAFCKLPITQARRFLLVHALGFSYVEVAQMEGCSRNAVKHSLVIARKNLQKILSNRLPNTSSEFGSD